MEDAAVTPRHTWWLNWWFINVNLPWGCDPLKHQCHLPTTTRGFGSSQQGGRESKDSAKRRPWFTTPALAAKCRPYQAYQLIQLNHLVRHWLSRCELSSCIAFKPLGFPAKKSNVELLCSPGPFSESIQFESCKSWTHSYQYRTNDHTKSGKTLSQW